MPLMLTILVLTLCCLILLGACETWLHRKRLQTIPIRIHVNGTRGKSSVTRLIAAGLRAGGIRTIAKTTGTLPRFILPNGKEFPVFRPGKPSISEQMRMLRLASKYEVAAIVFECMALQPWLQWMSESRMLQSTLGVITNCRADHLEFMGPTEQDVSKALCGTIPVKGKLFTAEKKYLSTLEHACQDRNTELIAIPEAELNNLSDLELKKFSYLEHPENIALALNVCNKLGVDRLTALQGMQAATPDAGALQEFVLNFFGKKIVFFNGFAANDPYSTQKVWQIAIELHPELARKIIVLNCRMDRPERSLQFAQAIPQWTPAHHIVVMGNGTYIFAKAAIQQGIAFDKIHFADDFSVEETFELIISLCEGNALVVGMGNIAEPGLSLVQHFKNRTQQQGNLHA